MDSDYPCIGNTVHCSCHISYLQQDIDTLINHLIKQHNISSRGISDKPHIWTQNLAAQGHVVHFKSPVVRIRGHVI